MSQDSWEVSDKVPKKGNALSRWFGRFIFRIFGWRWVGDMPDLDKYIVVVAPHTSNWDYIFVVGVIKGLGIHANFLVKSTFDVWPIRGLMRWTGVMPLDRSSPQGMVGQMTERFGQDEGFILGITPEGTRGKVREWKKGFLYIARDAKVPVCVGTLDYKKKEVRVYPPIEVGEDIEAALEQVKALSANVHAKYQDLV